MNKLLLLSFIFFTQLSYSELCAGILPVDNSYTVSIDNLSEGSIEDNAVGLQTYVQKTTGSGTVQLTPTVGKSSNTNSVQIVNAGFRNLSGGSSTVNALSITNSSTTSALAVTDTPLCYPNPFSQSSLTRLQYSLNKDANIEIQVYNMLANLILKQTYMAGSQGGASGRNLVKIQDVGGYQLSVGAYFIFIVSDGKVLSRAKVAVIP